MSNAYVSVSSAMLYYMEPFCNLFVLAPLCLEFIVMLMNIATDACEIGYQKLHAPGGRE